MSEMVRLTSKPVQPSCLYEYTPLKQVIMCPPTFLEIKEVINETQRKYVQENINQQLALKQYDNWIEEMRKFKIDIFFLQPHPEFPDQVFTRDIAFTIGYTTQVAKLKKKIRHGEEQVLVNWLNQQLTLYRKMNVETIEGGDVLIDGEKIWIGVSHRTSLEAIQEIEQHYPQFSVIQVPFAARYLHLDCVFNMISPHEAIIFPQAFSSQTLSMLSEYYDLIEVTEEEQFTLGTNVLVIDDQVVFSQPINSKINHQLRKRGFQVLEFEISEIIKSGGAFRCMTMPLKRRHFLKRPPYHLAK